MVQKSPLSRPDGFKFFKFKIHRHFGTLDILLSTLDILLSTLDILPSTLDILPSTLDILPSTLDILPSTLDPQQKPTLEREGLWNFTVFSCRELCYVWPIHFEACAIK